MPTTSRKVIKQDDAIKAAPSHWGRPIRAAYGVPPANTESSRKRPRLEVGQVLDRMLFRHQSGYSLGASRVRRNSSCASLKLCDILNLRDVPGLERKDLRPVRVSRCHTRKTKVEASYAELPRGKWDQRGRAFA